MGYAFSETYDKILQLSDAQAAYLAGMIDADGTVTFQSKSGRRASGLRYMPAQMVLVVNTNWELICWLKDTIGFGCAYETKASPVRPDQNSANWKKVHRYQIVGRAARRLLERIRPFMIVKAAHADLVVSLPTRGIEYIGQSSEEHLSLADDLLLRVRELNKR